jgi:hypothetical protein
MTREEIEKQIHLFNKSSLGIKLRLRITKTKHPVNEDVFKNILSLDNSTKMKKAIARNLYERGYKNIEIANILSVPPHLSHYYAKFFNFKNETENYLYLQVKRKI